MSARPTARFWVGVAAVVALVCLVGGVAIDRRISEAQLQDASEELLLLMELRRSALDAYFDTVRSELKFWSLGEELRSALANLRRGWDGLGEEPEQLLQSRYIQENPHPVGQRGRLAALGDGSSYDRAHGELHPLAGAFVSERGYYDFFLIDPAGNVVYSVEKEADFATNLVDGSWRGSGLAEVYRRALSKRDSGEVVFSDFQPYAPSEGAPALFAAIPVLASTGELAGVLAVQVPTERIQAIMQFTAGMGGSGETYLVGRDRLMRSDSRFSEDSTTLVSRVETATVEKAFAGETGVEFTDDYRGTPVLSAFGLFTLDGFDWAVMAEIDRDEVLEEVAELRLSIPLVGLALYALSMLSLWYLGTSDWLSADFDSFDPGEPPML